MRPILAFLCAAVLNGVTSSQGILLDAVALLDAYDRGDYVAVARQLESADDIRRLDRLDADLKERAKDWIGAVGAPERRRRAFVAGALALEVTHAVVERASWATDIYDSHGLHPEALPHIHRVLAEELARPDALEYDWTLAQLATWQEWNARARLTASDRLVTPEPVWAVLLGEPQLGPHGRVQAAFGRGGYLREALDRFPNDPRLMLAVTEGRESLITRCATLYCFDEATPAILAEVRARAKTRPPDGGDRHVAEARRIFSFAVANLKAFDQLLPMATEFASLARTYPTVRAEASVHTGYLAIRAARPDVALGPLATAAESPDPHVRYLAHYFTGRALTMLGQRKEAIAAYRRALVTVPNAPSAATLLAAALFLSDDATDREEAHVVLETANAAGILRDPWDRYWYGDARLWPVYMERLRQALRQ